ncbi:MAG: MarR family transcriptional regulator [Acidimicrobiaceae bacterium]|nr:MarR family transcriptional regulator [Acidimicrobiaceae bacterium]
METVIPLSTVCPSSDERVTLFALLLDTNARLSRSFAVRLEETCALPLAWFEVLLQLRRTPEGSLKMNEVAEAIVHSTGGTTRLIDRLEEAGLVQRQLCPSDRRAIHVAITAQGNLKLDDALSVHMGYLEEHLSSRLTCDERAELTVLLTKLNATR